jgi:hypothetical protein
LDERIIGQTSDYPIIKERHRAARDFSGIWNLLGDERIIGASMPRLANISVMSRQRPSTKSNGE